MTIEFRGCMLGIGDEIIRDVSKVVDDADWMDIDVDWHDFVKSSLDVIVDEGKGRSKTLFKNGKLLAAGRGLEFSAGEAYPALDGLANDFPIVRTIREGVSGATAVLNLQKPFNVEKLKITTSRICWPGASQNAIEVVTGAEYDGVCLSFEPYDEVSERGGTSWLVWRGDYRFLKGKTLACLFREMGGMAKAAPEKIANPVVTQPKSKSQDKAAFPDGYIAGKPQGRYLIIDLGKGVKDSKFEVSYLDAEPASGWSDDYKMNKIVLRLVEAGTFEMGSDNEEDGNPLRHVVLSNPFYIGVFPVTYSQWMLVMGRDTTFERWANLGKGPKQASKRCLEDRMKECGEEYATCPIGGVSYECLFGDVSDYETQGKALGIGWPRQFTAQEGTFFEILRRKTGVANFGLPTEAQWECACRANEGYGCDLTDNSLRNAVAWYRYLDKAEHDYVGNSEGKLHAVGLKRPNGWGLYDFIGNVDEWVLDWADDAPLKGDQRDPIGPRQGKYRVLRGGGFSTMSDNATYSATCRRHGGSWNVGDELGFRLACALKA